MQFGVVSGVCRGMHVLDGGPHYFGKGKGRFWQRVGVFLSMAFLTSFVRKNCIRLVRENFITFITQTNTRLTEGIGDKPVPIPAYALLYYSDATKNVEFCGWAASAWHGTTVRMSRSQQTPDLFFSAVRETL